MNRNNCWSGGWSTPGSTPVGISPSGSVGIGVASIGSVASIGVSVVVAVVAIVGISIGIGISGGIGISLTLNNMDGTAGVGVVASNGQTSGVHTSVVGGQRVVDGGVVHNGGNMGDGVNLDLSRLLNDGLDGGGAVDSGSDGANAIGVGGVVESGVGEDTAGVEEGGIGLGVSGGSS